MFNKTQAMPFPSRKSTASNNDLEELRKIVSELLSMLDAEVCAGPEPDFIINTLPRGISGSDMVAMSKLNIKNDGKILEVMKGVEFETLNPSSAAAIAVLNRLSHDFFGPAFIIPGEVAEEYFPALFGFEIPTDGSRVLPKGFEKIRHDSPARFYISLYSSESPETWFLIEACSDGTVGIKIYQGTDALTEAINKTCLGRPANTASFNLYKMADVAGSARESVVSEASKADLDAFIETVAQSLEKDAVQVFKSAAIEINKLVESLNDSVPNLTNLGLRAADIVASFNYYELLAAIESNFSERALMDGKPYRANLTKSTFIFEPQIEEKLRVIFVLSKTFDSDRAVEKLQAGENFLVAIQAGFGLKDATSVPPKMAEHWLATCFWDPHLKA